MLIFMVYVAWKLNNPSHKSFKGKAKLMQCDDFHTVGIAKLEKIFLPLVSTHALLSRDSSQVAHTCALGSSGYHVALNTNHESEKFEMAKK